MALPRRAPVALALPALAGGLLGLLAGCGAGSGRPAGNPGASSNAPAASAAASPAASPAAAVLGVTCAPDGVHVDSSTVAATAAGVVLRVRRTAPPGTYLNLGWAEGEGQGFPAPASGSVTVPVPPGLLTLTCGQDRSRAAAVSVSDPGGHWRATTLADVGCAVGGAPSWGAGSEGTGRTARAAVAAAVAALQQGGGFTGKAGAEQADVGYPEAPQQTWIVSVNGRPRFTVQARRTAGGWSAAADLVCAG